MILTILDRRLRPSLHNDAAGARGWPARLAGERGDTLIEVLISAVLLAVIVAGTFTALDGANHSTALQRSRSQADTLAQQDEDRLRSLPVATLTKLEHEPATQTVEMGGVKYELTSSSKYIVDNTATTDCASTALKAEYIQTISTVRWHSLGPGLPVVETGIVSPPPDTSLIVQVTDTGKPVPGITVEVVGPSTASAVTSTTGCAILAVAPGEYQINVHSPGYVDQNWFENSKEDEGSVHVAYLPAETTTKESYIFAPAARVNPLTFEELNPTTGAREPAKALNVILENSQMQPAYRLLRPEGSSTYVSSITSSYKIFPYPSSSPYTAYAGACRANRPPSTEPPTEVVFPSGGEISVKVLMPSLIVKVWQNAEKETPEKLVTSAPEVFLSDVDKGCEATYRQQETVVPTAAGGALKYPGQPWGSYMVCVNVAFKNKAGIIEDKHVEAAVLNKNAKKEGTTVNLYEGGANGTGLESEFCP
jgi:hypothetical protein